MFIRSGLGRSNDVFRLLTWYVLIGLSSITRANGWSENHFGSADLMSPSPIVDHGGRRHGLPTFWDAAAPYGGAE